MTNAHPWLNIRTKGIALAAVTALALTGCGSDEDDNDSAQSPTVDTSTPSPSPQEGEGPQVDLDEHASALVAAGRTAESSVDGSRVIQIEFDDGRWEVDVADAEGAEHEVQVSEDGSEITRGPEKDDTDGDDREENRRLLGAAQVDHEQAVQLAASEVADGRIVELQLDEEQAAAVWDLELEGGQELRFDASSGDLLGN